MEESFIQEFDNSLPDMLCDEIIQMFEMEEYRYVGVTLGGVNPNVKDTTDFMIPKNDSKWKKIEECLNKELNRCLSIYFNNVITDGTRNTLNVKNFMIQKYLKKEGKYAIHDDFMTLKNEYRVITFLWYLNDVNVGGETSFWKGKKNIIPKKGKLLLFPASWCYAHEGKMPISNDKYILTNWFYTNDFSKMD
jgi:hypothetical protein